MQLGRCSIREMSGAAPRTARDPLPCPTARWKLSKGVAPQRSTKSLGLEASDREAWPFHDAGSRPKNKKTLHLKTCQSYLHCHPQPKPVTVHDPSVQDREAVDYKTGHPGLHQSARPVLGSGSRSPGTGCECAPPCFRCLPCPTAPCRTTSFSRMGAATARRCCQNAGSKTGSRRPGG